MNLLELKANFLYRLFNRNKITTFKVDENPLAFVSDNKNIEEIRIENISEIKIISGHFFSSLLIFTNDNIIHKIPYIPKNRTKKILKLLPILKAYSKCKDINIKIYEKFSGNEYISYRDNLIFYRKTIENNKSTFSYKYDFELIFKNFKFYQKFNNLCEYAKNREKFRLVNNKQFLSEEPERAQDYLKGLNERQALAVMLNEDNVMVVAGAGSGKTKVIEQKVHYLINKLHVEPSEILLLAFNKDAVSELQERIECLPELNIRTFHSLGNKIMGLDKEKRLVDFAGSENKYQEFIRSLLIKTLTTRPFYNILFLYFQSFFYKNENPYHFNSQGEYNNYIKENKIVSLKSEEVKSFGEVDIANFLYIHGIPYEYEAEYKGKYEKTFEYGTYRPDFYIPKNDEHDDIYIEYFGIDKNGKTPPYINNEKYNQSINWKQSVHKENNTILIELYYYNKLEGNLLKELKHKLKKYNVDCNNILPAEKRFQVLNETKAIDDFTKLLSTFLTNYKANKHKYALLWNNVILKLRRLYSELALIFADMKNRKQINNLNYEVCLIKRKQAFLKIFKTIYDQYEGLLKENNKYDFSDMIVTATDRIYNCYEKNTFDYKYILVDEFQDMSLGRGDFIKKLISMHEDSKLFVVGDDWQSINRFAGSYLALMIDFEDEFGEGGTRKTEIIKLNKVYRFNDSISEISSKFIQENPNQIKKEIIANHTDEPSVLVWYDEDKISALRAIIELIHKELEARGVYAKEELINIPSVLVLGRYNLKPNKERDKDLISEIKELNENYKDKLIIEYMTMHKSKGLGRDYVIILDLQEGAFPSTRSDDPILEMVLSAKDSFPNAEERRLFYVALTRAKNKVYLYSGKHPSSFLNELTEPEKEYPIFICNQPDNYAVQKCPFCNTGLMVKPLSDNDKFYYCQSKLCKQKAPACPVCNKGFLYENKEINKIICSNCGYIAEKCFVCGGILLHRNSKSGVFIGCSNYQSNSELSCKNHMQAEKCKGCRNKDAFLYRIYNHVTHKITKNCSNKECQKNNWQHTNFG